MKIHVEFQLDEKDVETLMVEATPAILKVLGKELLNKIFSEAKKDATHS